MELRATSKCKKAMQVRLLLLGIEYDPRYHPVPTITETPMAGGVVTSFHVGQATIVLKDPKRAEQVKEIVETYHAELKEARRFFKTRKNSKPSKGGIVPSDQRPARAYNDIQDDLDKAMGGIGIAMGIAGTIILFAFLLLMKKIGH